MGSADYFSDAIEGQVNGLVAPRSPGSTLKPFVYGLALDQGLIHSETILFDTPRRFAAYEPENADGRFEGPVGAAKALRMSRNVPAVDLVGRISPDLYDFLLLANIKLPFPREHYGLSIVLGGAEVSPLNVAKLYAALHAGGRMTEPRLFADDPKAASVPLLSREAAWIVRAMLANPRNDLKRSGRTLSLPYKTGTSNGFRDAWTAGLVGPYVALVWLGNFDNAPNPHLLGEDAAAPLFKTVARLLASDPTYGRDVFQTAEKPEGVVSIDVCRATGDIPHGRCTDTVPAWFIPGKSPVRDTGVLREIWIGPSRLPLGRGKNRAADSGGLACARNPRLSGCGRRENAASPLDAGLRRRGTKPGRARHSRARRRGRTLYGNGFAPRSGTGRAARRLGRPRAPLLV